MKKSEELRNKQRELLQSKEPDVLVNREEYIELLHEVVVSRHKLRRRVRKSKPPGDTPK